MTSMTNSFPICFFSLADFRTESVAEKMLTNWFTFLLYKFLKVRGAACLDEIAALIHFFLVRFSWGKSFPDIKEKGFFSGGSSLTNGRGTVF